MEQAAEKERFTVKDASSAEWVMEKIAEKQAEIAEMTRQRDKMLARYNEWYTAVTFVGTPVDKTNADFVAMVKKSAPEYVETKESVKWGDLKKTLTFADGGKVISADGEVLTEMAWTQPEPTFYANVKGGE